jgi:DNA-binding NtrC family response regulator
MNATSQRRDSDPAALVIDADAARRASLGRWVDAAGFSPAAAETPEKALSELSGGRFELVLADPTMLDAEGAALFAELADRPTLPVTGCCIPAPSDRGSRPGDPGLSRFGRLIGTSRTMQSVYDRLLRVATTEANVFLVGESGTGKELAAELTHRLSARAESPFVPVNCGALSPGLIESELFGHERGSFTGADRRRPGLFERARGGTLFLDEITEMPADLQVKLLRVLESRTVRRVGGNEVIDVDVRVIAATNRDPEEAVDQGRLRADLMYRLLVFPVELPPLRERPEDVALIARHYLDRLNGNSDVEKTLTDGAMEALATHGWPGNVRELRNAVERAFIVADDVISESCFALGSFGLRATGAETLGVRVGMTIAEAERILIEATLARVDGDKRKAAKALGISTKTLYTRLAVYRAASGG